MSRVSLSFLLAALTVAGAAQAQDTKPAFTQPGDGVPARPVMASLTPAAIPDPRMLCNEQDRTAYSRALQGQIAVAEANLAIGQAYAAALDTRLKALLIDPVANAESINRIRAEMDAFDAPMMASFQAGKSLKADLEAAPAVILGRCAQTQVAAAPLPAPASPAPAIVTAPVFATVAPPAPVAAVPPAPPPIVLAAITPPPVAPATVPIPFVPAPVIIPPAPTVTAAAPAVPRVIAAAEPVAASTARPDQELIIGRPAVVPEPESRPIVLAAAAPAVLPRPEAPGPPLAPASVAAPAPAVRPAAPVPALARPVTLNPAVSGDLPARTVVWRTKGKSGSPLTADVTLSPSWSLKGDQLVVDWSANRPGGYSFGIKEGAGTDLPDGLDAKADEWVSYVIVTLDNGEVLYLKRPDFVRRNYLKVADSDRLTLPRGARGVRKLQMVFGRGAEGATAEWDFG